MEAKDVQGYRLLHLISVHQNSIPTQNLMKDRSSIDLKNSKTRCPQDSKESNGQLYHASNNGVEGQITELHVQSACRS